jgi:hypothetical protein
MEQKKYFANIIPAIYFYNVAILNFEEHFYNLEATQQAEYLSTKSINQVRHSMNNMSHFLGHNLFTSII